MNRFGIQKFLVLFFLFIFCTASVFASDSEIQTQRINPGSALYIVKRATEKAWGYLKFSESSKTAYTENLLNRRLGELDYVSQNDTSAEIEKTSQRFSFYAGELANKVGASGNEDKKKELLSKFESYTKHLEKMRDRFSANSGEWLFVQQNIDTLSLLSEKLK